MAFVSEELLRWALQELRHWQATVTRVRGRQTFPRFLTLKRLGVPADGSFSELFSTGDFQTATKELFLIATAEEAGATQLGPLPRYLNPFTGSYQRGGGTSDWAVGTLWTRSTDDHAIEIAIPEDEEAGNSQPRRFRFRDDYVAHIQHGLGGHIPLVPLCIFLARKGQPWLGGATDLGFADGANLVQAIVDGLGLTPQERQGLFQEGAFPNHPFSQQALTDQQILAASLDVFPPTQSAAAQAPLVATPAAQANGGHAHNIDWNATYEGEEPCGLRGLGPAFSKAKAALVAGKHVVLYGPPGTGKSQLAECICKALGATHILTTATSDWTTFDTIGGYFPDHEDPTILNFLPGQLVSAMQAESWVIIDEINRADIDKAFGQLFSILAGQTVELPFFDRAETPPTRVSIGPASGSPAPKIEVTDDWRLIGTMNTFDKSSLFQLSYALMRRFAFVDVPAPESDVLQEIMGAAIETWPEDGREAAGEKLIHVFCADEGLRSVGREVGAAIPLDICRAVGMAPDPNVSDTDLVDYLDMYLFPQFEGLDRDHLKLFQALKTTLELDEPTATTLQRKLAGWTGYRQ